MSVTWLFRLKDLRIKIDYVAPPSTPILLGPATRRRRLSKLTGAAPPTL